MNCPRCNDKMVTVLIERPCGWRCPTCHPIPIESPAVAERPAETPTHLDAPPSWERVAELEIALSSARIEVARLTAERDDLAARVAEEHATVVRLTGLISGDINVIRQGIVEYDGQWKHNLQMRHVMFLMFAESAAGVLDANPGAVNLVSMNIQSAKYGKLEVTIRKPEGKTAAEVLGEQKETIAALEAERDELRRGLRVVTEAAAEQPAPRWQPIETAPKDGAEILAWYTKRPFWSVRVVRYDYEDASWSTCGPLPLRQPTHWQPLPTPPGAEHPASAEQPAPTGEGTDVVLDLVAAIANDRGPRDLIRVVVTGYCKALGWDLPDALRSRREKGIATYGTPLRTGNGRDARTDCAQELLDALAYAWQARLEGEGR